ncbi:YfhO family protein [Sphingobacterium corticis]|uniref:YfhO family protein n=1 Tax=Sphingobacterium corticis TaxID=1812823 RepID=A0ABW5NI43_9SPHI
MKTWFKENASHLTIIAILIVLVFFYFTPVWQGKTLAQSDVVQAAGGQKEMFDFKEKDGDAPLWTNSMFGGMPVYQIWLGHEANVTTYISKALRAVFPPPSDILLLYLLGGYFLFSVLRVKPWLAAVGAVALAFSSYNMIYIEAGHMNKAYAIAYMAPIIGSIILCYRGSWLWGGSLLALFMALEIRTNHIQVTYYLFIALLVLVGFELYYAIRDKQVKKFVQNSAVQLGAVLVAVMVNATVLFPTYEYSKLTTRGKANITSTEQGGSSDSGLSKEYAYGWSQGVGENLTLLIPNAYGGRSGGVLDGDSHVAKFVKSLNATDEQAAQFAQSMQTYWGEKMFTSGPWYFGAGIIFLFILGIVIVQNKYKWWLVSATVLTIFLAFGKHLPFISDLFFDYFPMYNKFRAVESILVIPSVLIPILAIMAVDQLISRPTEVKNLDKKLLYVGGSVAALCLLVALIPDLFLNFRSSTHQQLVATYQQQVGDAAMGNELVNALLKDRAAIASADAWRSLLIVVLTFGAIWFFVKKKASLTVMLAVVGLVTLADLWTVDKRYLNNDSFMSPTAVQDHMPKREVDDLILMDKDPSYRVFDLSTSPFQDARQSYYHKSLGGYHAAKLMRFQEILEHQFNGAINEDVLDMFNVRYVITQDQKSGSERIQRRSSAAGNAWFVDKITIVKDDNEEMNALDSFNPRKEAFVSKAFEDKIKATQLGNSSNSDINLVSYHPDTMRYEYTAPRDAFAVFSEVYYDKGWKAYVDGEEVPIIRADYLLRALQLPGGNHTVEFVFAPQSMKISTTLSLIFSVLMVLGIGAALFFQYRKKQNTPKAHPVGK